MTVIVASTPTSKKINGNQERLEAIFHTVDTIKSDLSKCGMRLQACREFSGITPFATTNGSFTGTYGLPAGLLGLVIASLIAAFMSTISTHLNWGASYIVNDFYRRFIGKNPPGKTTGQGGPDFHYWVNGPGCHGCTFTAKCPAGLPYSPPDRGRNRIVVFATLVLVANKCGQ
ncbi:MAG: hypothetical protein MUO31_11000 [Thermodesulfovibrionales bacterium]|nr:hypothetical protein [Thermodesulfovibrionales bacterium]